MKTDIIHPSHRKSLLKVMKGRRVYVQVKGTGFYVRTSHNEILYLARLLKEESATMFRFSVSTYPRMVTVDIERSLYIEL